MWACALDVRKHPRRLVIWATSMERADMPGNQASGTERLLSDVPAREVQAALERERAEHPGTVVEWGAVTRGTLGRRGDAVSAWAALTGVRIVLDPAPERDSRATLQSRYGGSGSGFGTSSRRFGGYGGGGVGGGGDGGGGGGDGGGGG
ncbi:hypothetical protein [Actinomadura sp. 21ATH]|uniref:hypothetical protein n=1 Tax=Actinomadura sp. 21ATH TaxID=1735444 RepID=UPI0035C17E4E